MSGSNPHDETHATHHGHVVMSPERVIVTGHDAHPSDEDMTSEQTSHASETSQAEGEADEDDGRDE
ncbi:hypothetical protein [Yinghuangia seranimata]|uniref:hypothetical protein n=1 Tax=Yinghuangia seranimata TaxID=408067 RepID=UPI00248ABD8A|nr:hypothetical protein [Yinghuangia seranimata]MDI2132897.1 hypothetical protein [Yinghuangia seranimata]